MDKARERHVAEMRRLKDAIDKTKSAAARRDYTKAYKRMQRELAEYDRFRKAVP